MKKLFRKLHKNNDGATLIMAIVAIAFIGVLAGVIISATGAAYRMRIMNENSKKSFYSAESVVEEIYAGVGRACYESLSDAYVSTAGSMYMYDISKGTTYKIKNDALNAAMRSQYIVGMQEKILGTEGEAADNAAAFLTSYINNQSNARIVNIGSVSSTDEGVFFDDVLIEYRSSGKSQYFSTVQIDLNVEYPDIYIDFMYINEDWNEYLNYCLIAMGDISVNGGVGLSMAGGVFAGEDFNIAASSSVSLENAVIVGKIPSRIVAGGMIDLGRRATFTVNSADVWCDNLNIGKDADNADIIYTSSDSHTYVADDLTLDGEKSKVILMGYYTGFGASNDLVSASSAIVINGMKCTLDMSGIRELTLAGKGYINLVNEDDPTSEWYQTGDSLALKGNQQIYLVPGGYVKSAESGASATNPTSTPDKVTVDLSNFFAYRLGLLDETQPYVAKKVAAKTYYYLNFKSTSAQNNYVRAIITDGYLDALFADSGVSGPTTADRNEKKALYSYVEAGLMRFFSEGDGIKMNGSASVYTSGTLVKVTRETSGSSIFVVGSSSVADLTARSATASNKYKVIKSFLTTGSDTNDFSHFPIDLKIGEAEFSVSDSSDDLISVYDRTVNVSRISTITKSVINFDVSSGTVAAALTYKDENIGNTYTVPVNYNGGVIVAYGVDITVSANFEGLIITDKSITVSGNAAVTPGSNGRAKNAIDTYRNDDDESNDIHIFFNETEDSSETPEIGNIGVEDMLQLSDWRKNESA